MGKFPDSKGREYVDKRPKLKIAIPKELNVLGLIFSLSRPAKGAIKTMIKGHGVINKPTIAVDLWN
jgi:hypothetical protein